MAAPTNLVNLLVHQLVNLLARQLVNLLARQLVNLSMCCQTELDLQRHNVHRKPTRSDPLPLRKVVFTFSPFQFFTLSSLKGAAIFSPFHFFALSPLKGASIFSPFHFFTLSSLKGAAIFSPFHFFTLSSLEGAAIFSLFHLFTLSPLQAWLCSNRCVGGYTMPISLRPILCNPSTIRCLCCGRAFLRPLA